MVGSGLRRRGSRKKEDWREKVEGLTVAESERLFFKESKEWSCNLKIRGGERLKYWCRGRKKDFGLGVSCAKRRIFTMVGVYFDFIL